MSTVAQRPSRGYRALRLPIAEDEYEHFFTDTDYARMTLDKLYERYPELFPQDWPQSCAFYGFTDESKKQSLRCRRVRLRTDKTVWTVAPAFVMPYGSGRTEEVEKALLR